MKASLFLVGASAILATASPIRAKLNERALETEWVYEVVTVTVTAGKEEEQPTAAAFLEVPEKAAPKPAVTTTTSKKEAPKLKPTTKEAPKLKPTPKEAPKPKPTTKEAPKPEPTTTKEAPKPEPTTTIVEEEAEETQAASGLSLDNDYETIMINYHNVHRLNHSAPAIEWDDTLAGYALNTANGCVFEHDM